MPALHPAKYRGGTVAMNRCSYNGHCVGLFFRLLATVLFASESLRGVRGAAPTFIRSVWYANVSENAAVGTSVLRVEATDADGDALDYSIWGGQNHNHFSLGFSSGVLKTSRSLDREKVESYSLTVTVTDYIDFPQATVIIKVLDVNDNPPFCNPATVMVTLSEAVAVGTHVTTISCTDADLGLNAQLKYRVTSGNVMDVFTVQNSSGILETAKELDYEQSTFYKLTVTATDMGLPTPLHTNVTVLIPIQGINEYTPRFGNSSYAATVVARSPSGATVLRVNAEDIDSGPDGMVTYRKITNASDQFSVNTSSGDIIVSSVLHYDCLAPENNVFRFTVAAADRGNPVKSTLVNVTITMIPLNTHKPSCSPAAYVKSVSESVQPGTLVLQVICSDPDGNPLTYAIIDGDVSNAFNITEHGELITRNELDYELQKSYDLVITVKESCVPAPRNAAVSVRVQTTGVNEHSPTFPASKYNVSVREDAEIGTTILQLNATDYDEGADGDVSYSISLRNTTSSTAFLIDRLSGMLLLARSLDREMQDAHLLRIEAIDGGQNNRKTGSALVNITVDDVNDNVPVCRPSVIVTTVEKTVHVGTTVATLSCHDSDANFNGRLSYQIPSGQNTDVFTVSSRGEIRIDSSLAQPSLSDLYSFLVTVSDNGYPSLAVNGSVVVQLIGNRGQTTPPVFQMPIYYASLYENATIGTTVITVSADDPINSAVRYSIITSDEETILAVDPTSGDIVLTGTLDREMKDSYTLVVEASVGHSEGQRGKSLATVSVNVSDVNDNPPSCLERILTVSLSESTPPFTTIAQLHCSDVDTGDNGELTYRIADPMRDSPIILTNDGQIRTNVTLDYESTRSFSVIAAVYDGGMVPKHVNVSVKILVEPVNEFPPVFLFNALNISIQEDTFVGTVITNIQATDSDFGKDGQVTYTVTGDGGPLPFAVETATGRVILTATLDRETLEFYAITVSATDGGTISKTARLSLLVTVLDKNDNTPSCQLQTIVVSLSEDVQNGTEVARLDCNDLDQGDNGKLVYNITTQHHVPFNTDSTGRIYVSRLVTHYHSTVYTFPVQVADSGTPRRTSTVQVIVSLPGQQNEKALNPIFDRLVVSINAPENIAVGRVLTRLNCTVSLGNCPHFNITEGDDTHCFHVGLLGDLTVAHPIDYETSQRYRLTVVCTDSADRSRFASSFVDIQVTDVNEFSPVFSQNRTTVTVSEDQEVGGLVTKVTATDGDHDSSVTYSIVHVIPPDHPFILDPTSGRISLIRKMDRELVDRYDINITASDQAKQGFTSVRITVSDFNDNQPHCLSLVQLIQLDGTERMDTVVGELNCTDKDAGNNGLLSYRLIGNWSHLLAVNSQNGQLTLAQDVSAARVLGDVAMKVLVSDNGRPISFNETVELVVRLLQRNRYPPEFLLPNRRIIEVNESERLGSRLGQITARDRDETDALSSPMQYELSQQHRKQPFFLDRWTGILYLINVLDREKIESYLLTIEATDRGSPVRRTATADIAIAVLDDNDNPPVCTPAVYGSVMSAVALQGTVVARLNCSDADLGQNAALQYEVQADKGMGRTFHANSTGHVIFQNRTGHNADLQILQLPVVVRDRGTVSLSTTVVVVVRVLDEQTDRLDILATLEPEATSPNNNDEPEWVKNSVEVQLLDVGWKEWVSSGRSAAKALFALAATVYCSGNPNLCSVTKPTGDQSNSLVLFQDSDVVLIQSKQSIISGHRQLLLVSLYISLPVNVHRLPGALTSTVVPQATVGSIMDYARLSLEARYFTVGGSWAVTSLFPTESGSATQGGVGAAGEASSENKILAITTIPAGVMLIVCLLLGILLYRQRRRRKTVPVPVVIDRSASVIGGQLENPSIGCTHNLSTFPGHQPSQRALNDVYRENAQDRKSTAEVDDFPVEELSTMSLPRSSYCHLSGSSSNGTILPGALASTEDSDDPDVRDTIQQIQTKSTAYGTTERNHVALNRSRSRVLQRLNTKLKLGVIDFDTSRAEDSGIESDLRRSYTPLACLQTENHQEGSNCFQDVNYLTTVD